MPTTPHPLWPLFDLRLRTERLVLRLPTDDDLVALAALAREGIHPPDEMPFAFPWSTQPSPAFEQNYIRYHWSVRGRWKPDDWTLDLLVEAGGEPIGMQGVSATDFRVLRTVTTGSWVGQRFQRQGYGREMREAIVRFAFDGLGAEVAETQAFTDNAASNAVSRAVGYEENGIGRLAPQGVPRDTIRYRLTRERWAERERPPLVIEGLDRCRALFGIADEGAETPPRP